MSVFDPLRTLSNFDVRRDYAAVVATGMAEVPGIMIAVVAVLPVLWWMPETAPLRTVDKAPG